MGCACIARNVEINKKEVELDQTKSIQQESSTNVKTLSKQATEEFFEIKQCKINNLKVQKKNWIKKLVDQLDQIIQISQLIQVQLLHY